MTAKANAQRGFTLLEVMVAFAIAAMSVTLLAEIFGKAAVNAGHTREVSGALNVAESVLDEASVSHATIEDNGIGREASAKLRQKPIKQHKSMGMKITSDRLEMINDTHFAKASMEIVDLYDEEQQAIGTQVILRIPF